MINSVFIPWHGAAGRTKNLNYDRIKNTNVGPGGVSGSGNRNPHTAGIHRAEADQIRANWAESSAAEAGFGKVR